MNRTSFAFITACLCVLGSACSKTAAPAREPASAAQTTAGNVGNIHVDDELAKKCHLTFGSESPKPTFDYDGAALLPQDRDLLQQVAACVTTGPLKGRGLALTGRADPRGETEYNMALGGHRADAVNEFLAKLGVAPGTISKTSRGELDAEGKDESSWKHDRRVDIALR